MVSWIDFQINTDFGFSGRNGDNNNSVRRDRTQLRLLTYRFKFNLKETTGSFEIDSYDLPNSRVLKSKLTGFEGWQGFFEHIQNILLSIRVQVHKLHFTILFWPILQSSKKYSKISFCTTWYNTLTCKAIHK